MTQTDLPAADELRRLAGWNQKPADWARMLSLEPYGCFTAKSGNQLVGTVTTTCYEKTLAWIGMMLVHPDYRRQGVGTALMKKALEYLQQKTVACVKLDATPAGLPLYAQLGFVLEWTLTRWQSPESRSLPVSSSGKTRILNETDWPSIELIDSTVLGVSRLRLLRRLARDSFQVRVWPAENRIAGWGMLRPGSNADYLGPLVCASAEGASTLIADLLAHRRNPSIFWDIPDGNETARSLAQTYAFQTVRPLTRMRFGHDAALGSPLAQFGIADPALG